MSSRWGEVTLATAWRGGAKLPRATRRGSAGFAAAGLAAGAAFGAVFAVGCGRACGRAAADGFDAAGFDAAGLDAAGFVAAGFGYWAVGDSRASAIERAGGGWEAGRGAKVADGFVSGAALRGAGAAPRAGRGSFRRVVTRCRSASSF
ncbi:MAG: hypothetical protein AAF938_20220 [Myxococcota bacterium]